MFGINQESLPFGNSITLDIGQFKNCSFYRPPRLYKTTVNYQANFLRFRYIYRNPLANDVTGKTSNHIGPY